MKQEVARAKALIGSLGFCNAAKKLGVSPATLGNFVEGGRLYEKTRARLSRKLAAKK